MYSICVPLMDSSRFIVTKGPLRYHNTEAGYQQPSVLTPWMYANEMSPYHHLVQKIKEEKKDDNVGGGGRGAGGSSNPAGPRKTKKENPIKKSNAK